METINLFEWITEKFLPLFGTYPTEEINFGWLGQFSIAQFLAFILFASIGVCTVHFLVWLPYKGILRLIRYHKWGKMK